MIDLSKLPPPQVIEILDVEAIKNEMIRDYEQKMRKKGAEFDPPILQNFSVVDSDPAMALIEVAAYREVLLRKRLNESVKQTFIAFAEKTNLDHLAVIFGTKRKYEENEPDESLRRRILSAFDQVTTAGTKSSYQWHTFATPGVSGIKNVNVYSPDDETRQGNVDVIVLFEDHQSITDNNLKARNIASYLETKKTLNDKLNVKLAEVQPGYESGFSVEATITISPGVDPSVVKERAYRAVNLYIKSRFAIGANINRSAIIAALHAPSRSFENTTEDSIDIINNDLVSNVERVELIEPASDINVDRDKYVFLGTKQVTENGESINVPAITINTPEVVD